MNHFSPLYNLIKLKINTSFYRNKNDHYNLLGTKIKFIEE